jgi:hypothetical protein
MAGTLVADTISDGSGNTTAMTNAVKGSAKAFVNFDGVTTSTIRSSYNVSSVTYNGGGDFTVNFTNAFADANYAIAGFVASWGNSTMYLCGRNNGSQSDFTTTSARVVSSYSNTSINSYSGYTCVAFYR